MLMNSSIFSWLLIPGLLILFFLFGSFITCRKKLGSFSIIDTLLIGFFLYFGLFQIFALPMKVLLMPLSYLCISWLIFVTIAVVVSLLFNRKYWIKFAKKTQIKDWWGMTLIFAIGVIIQIVVITNNISYGSFADASYYIADSARSVATNTIEQYNQYTGVLRSELDPLYVLLTYTAHNSMLSYITGIHPLIIWRQVMGAVVIILSNMVIYRIGCVVFKEKRGKAVIVWAVWLLISFFTYSAYTPGGFLFYRAFEGKTILAVLIIPVMLLQMIRSICNKFDRESFIESLIIEIGSLPFCMSSMMVIPVLVTVFYVPGVVAYKSKKGFLQYVLLVGIYLIELLCYMMISKGIWRVVIG